MSRSGALLLSPSTRACRKASPSSGTSCRAYVTWSGEVSREPSPVPALVYTGGRVAAGGLG
ncbi:MULTISPECIES: hypothetical protein, partial [unclassified Streptomyces]|uniref:hypothetical protein n=1 Tax=unclassified Streptomyces TaxID=2593676 RepID=UPI001C4037DC